MRFIHKQINKDTLNMRLAARANKMVSKREMASDLKSYMQLKLESEKHIATGKLYYTLKTSAPKRKFMKQMNSATNTYTVPFSMQHYGYDLDLGFKVTGKPFKSHYMAIKAWAKAKLGNTDSKFIRRVTFAHLAGVEIGGTNWLGYKDETDKSSALGMFMNSPKTYMNELQLAESAADFFWQEIYRVFPKEIGRRI